MLYGEEVLLDTDSDRKPGGDAPTRVEPCALAASLASRAYVSGAGRSSHRSFGGIAVDGQGVARLAITPGRQSFCGELICLRLPVESHHRAAASRRR